jgi:riboflavin synthase
MFTGITRGTFEVVSVVHDGGGFSFWVDLGDALSADLEIGASVAVDGVCQTAVAVQGTRVQFEAIEETLRVTTLGSLVPGARVSVERSLRAGDEIGGHEVAGHVTGTGEVTNVEVRDGVHNLRISVPLAWSPFILAKGFIALDGSSLTVGAVGPGWFEVHLIPETLRRTNLGHKRAGDRLNVELDPRTVAIVTTVERFLQQRFPDASSVGGRVGAPGAQP